MRPTPNRRPRRGFTLVELLVACALTVLIMAVLATAFQTGLSTFSHLKSTVGLSEQLRAAEAAIRRDLEATHLEDADGVALRVSKVTSLPSRGYLEVIQGSIPKQNYSNSDPYYEMGMTPGAASIYPYVIEGSEDKVTSGRATDHAVFFTSKLKGNSPQEVFLGRVPVATKLNPDLQDYATPGAAATEWAELGYFLAPSNVFTVSEDPTNSPPLKLFTLIRRQKLLGVTASGALMSTIAPESAYSARQWWENYSEASISTQAGMPDTARVNDPAFVVTRANRSYIVLNVPVAPATPVSEFNVLPAGGNAQGTDILVTNVVSMQIRLMNNAGVYVDQLPAGPNGFGLDTSTLPPALRMRAIQIKLRVYDTKNHLTRQITMTFDL